MGRRTYFGDLLGNAKRVLESRWERRLVLSAAARARAARLESYEVRSDRECQLSVESTARQSVDRMRAGSTAGAADEATHGGRGQGWPCDSDGMRGGRHGTPADRPPAEFVPSGLFSLGCHVGRVPRVRRACVALPLLPLRGSNDRSSDGSSERIPHRTTPAPGQPRRWLTVSGRRVLRPAVRDRTAPASATRPAASSVQPHPRPRRTAIRARPRSPSYGFRGNRAPGPARRSA